MEDEESAGGPRPPVALGCGILLALVVGVAVLFGTCVVFLESGADTGEVTLRRAETYPEGTVEFVGEHNIFVVRTQGGELLALDDMDEANRASAGRRCRVRLTNVDAPQVADTLESAASRMSPAARGAAVVLREDCNGAIYDVTGVRLDEDGRNLDRLATRVNTSGRVVVDLRGEECTARRGEELRLPVACGE